MIVAYVAGPFTAPDRAGVQTNIARAVAVGLEVARLGACPLIPHANTSHPNFEALQPYTFWIDATLELLRRSDALVTVPGWENSNGARGEVALAESMHIPVFHSIDEFDLWLRDGRSERDTMPDLVSPEGRMVGAERGLENA